MRPGILVPRSFFLFSEWLLSLPHTFINYNITYFYKYVMIKTYVKHYKQLYIRLQQILQYANMTQIYRQIAKITLFVVRWKAPAI
jgi:hypothetical protein